jgi:hypothetical protein
MRPREVASVIIQVTPGRAGLKSRSVLFLKHSIFMDAIRKSARVANRFMSNFLGARVCFFQNSLYKVRVLLPAQ